MRPETFWWIRKGCTFGVDSIFFNHKDNWILTLLAVRESDRLDINVLIIKYNYSEHLNTGIYTDHKIFTKVEWSNFQIALNFGAIFLVFKCSMKTGSQFVQKSNSSGAYFIEEIFQETCWHFKVNLNPPASEASREVANFN
jgi:hypothetical protein